VIEATLDSKGEVNDARVLSGPEELRRAALQSVLQWHYAGAPAPPSSVRATIQFGTSPTAGSAESSPAMIPKAVKGAAAPPQTGTLKSIQISGAPPELAQRVRDSLPVHEGDPVIIVAYRNGAPVSESMTQILNAARQVDEHFMGGLSINRDGEATVRLTLATPPPPPTPLQTTGVFGASRDAAPSSGPSRIRVGGNVQQANLISKVIPMYPADAKEARIQGVVHLAVIIGRDGTVQNIEVVSGHPLLVQAAMDAVKQWRYKPTLLNGNPVEVVTQVDVNFTLSQ